MKRFQKTPRKWQLKSFRNSGGSGDTLSNSCEIRATSAGPALDGLLPKAIVTGFE